MAIVIVLPLKAVTVRHEAMRHLEDLPGWANTVVADLLSEVHRLDERIAQYDRHVQEIARQSAPARQLMQLPGVGATTATALVAMTGRGHEFIAAGSYRLGSGLCLANTAPVASSDSDESPSPATRTYGCCCSWAHVQCCSPPRTRRIL